VGRYGQLTQLLGNGQVGSNAVNLEYKASKVFRPKAADFAEVSTKPTVRVIFSLLPHPYASCFNRCNVLLKSLSSAIAFNILLASV
jgi:hypothetical protein